MIADWFIIQNKWVFIGLPLCRFRQTKNEFELAGIFLRNYNVKTLITLFPFGRDTFYQHDSISREKV